MWLGIFLIGCVCGAFFGVMICALAIAAGNREDDDDRR